MMPPGVDRSSVRRGGEHGTRGPITVLFVAPLPEPVTGQSLACRVLLDGLPGEYRVELVDLTKRELRQGISSLARIREVLGILWRVWRERRAADVIYLTVSQSVAGNLKDLVIYLICFGRLKHMVIHLFGGAGMRRIMLGDGRLLRDVNTWFLKRLGAVIVEGRTQAGTYRAAVAPERLHVVPNFAEDELFGTPGSIAAKFTGIDPLRILFLSNLLPGKGHHELVEAYLGLDERTRAAIRIDFAGAFESEGQRDAFLARIAGEERIHYHGTVGGERKRGLLAGAHVFCLPTYYPYEGQPVSILEAFAAGCAVITTGHSGIPDVFQHEINGLQVAPRSVDDLRSAIRSAVLDPDRLQRMAMTNYETALDRYRASGFQRAVVQVIDSVARRS